MFKTTEALNVFFETRQNIGIKPGLDRMKYLLDSVGQPEENLATIHVAGTNGKGSTIAYLAAILTEASYQVGTFTSPSLTNRQAMIQLNGQPISDQLFLKYANRLIPGIEALDQLNNGASEFEIMVSIAYQFFADHAAISIIETGMGGLEDATNLVDPILSIITSIDYDHTAFLGETIKEITQHKAGIIKPNKPVVIGEIVDQAYAIIKKEALAKQAKVDRLGSTFQVIWIENRPYYKDEQTVLPLNLRLLGEHQFLNSALAIKSMMILNQQNYQITTEQIKTGIRYAHLPARFEQISDHPGIIIDGAHNMESIHAFIAAVNKTYQEVDKTLVFAAFKDKPIAEMLATLEPHFDEIIFTTFEHDRAESASRIFELSAHPNKHKHDAWEQIIDQINQKKHAEKVTFVVGSLDFVGKVRGYLV